MIPLAEWAPDQGKFDIVASDDVRNVIPAKDGKRPMPSFEAMGPVTVQDVRGVFTFRDAAGVAYTFYGSPTKLYKLDPAGAVWVDVTRTVGGDYALAVDSRWGMYQYGDDVIAFNGIDATQKFTLSSATNFAALGGSAPIASYGGVIGEFAVLARVAGATNKVKWSAIGNSASWAISATTLSDEQVFPDGGEITGFVGGEIGVVLQDSAIQRMTFEGSPFAFRFAKVSNTIGCTLPGSVAAYEDLIFFYSSDGFKMLRGGAEMSAIGDEKVDKWFAANAATLNLQNVNATIDEARRIYWVAFPSTLSMDGVADVMIGYHWPSGEWTKVMASFRAVYRIPGSKAFTIDSIDAMSDTIETMSDSPYWDAQQSPVMGAIDASGNLGRFTGAAMEAVIETKDFQLSKGKRTLLRGLRPIIEGVDVEPSVDVTAKEYMHDGAGVEFGPYEMNDYGYVPVRASGRYHRVRMTVPAGADWTHIRGIDDLKYSSMGMR